MKVKLKNGQTGTLIQKGKRLSQVQLDPDSQQSGGIAQVANEEFEETGSATAEEVKQPVKKEDADTTPKQPGILEIAGNASLLMPVFVTAFVEALQHPDVIAALRPVAKTKKKVPVKKATKKKK